MELLASLTPLAEVLTTSASWAAEVELEAATLATATTGATKSTAEAHVLEDFVDVHVGTATTEASSLLGSSSFSLLLLTDAFGSDLVVDASLVLIREDFIRRGNLLEVFLSSLWIIRVLVRMVLNRLLLECLLQLGLSGVLLHAE